MLKLQLDFLQIWLDLMMSKVFPNLNQSMILKFSFLSAQSSPLLSVSAMVIPGTTN